MGTSLRLVTVGALLLALSAAGCITSAGQRAELQPDSTAKSLVASSINKTVLIKLSCDVPYTSLVVGADGVPRIVKGVKKMRGHASGVILSSSRSGLSYVLTAAHVLKPTLKYKCVVTAHRSTSTPYKAAGVRLTIVAVSSDVDLAIASTPVYLGASSRVARTASAGDPITVIGYPAPYNDSYIKQNGLDESVSVSTGVIASILNKSGKAHDLRITAPIYFGNSGGPVFNARGEVVGIAVSFYGVRVGGSSIPFPAGYFAVPYHMVRDFLTKSGLSSLLK